MAGQGGLAREIRAGLEVIEGKAGEAPQKDKLDELFYRRPIRTHVKEFACVFAIIALVVAAGMLYKGRAIEVPAVLITGAFVLLLLGYMAPAVLHPVWKGWMKFAHYLGIVMTTLILFIAWSVMLVPIALLLRVLRIKVMNVKFKEEVETYWETREDSKHDFKLLERQF